MNNQKISLAMIVRDEANHLKACLDSVRNHVEEIVIVDTGSTDQTKDIAKCYTNLVYDFPWDDDFSAARNFALNKCTGDWILSLDADEELIGSPDSLTQLLASTDGGEAYLLPLENPTSLATGEFNRFFVLRLFKNNGYYRFQGRIHEQITVPDESLIRRADNPIIRHKMLPDKDRNRKRARNLALLKDAVHREPHNPFLQYYLGLEWLMLGKPCQALPYLKKSYLELPMNALLFRSPALRYLVICLQALNQLDEAICLCVDATRLYPDYADIYYLGGTLFEEKKEYQAAAKWFQEAKDIGTPSFVYSHMLGSATFLADYHLGYCLQLLNRVQEAITCYENALSANSQYIFPTYNLFFLLLAEYGPDAACRRFLKHNCWNETKVAVILADLLFASGFPRLSDKLLWRFQAPGNEELSFYRGKYSLLAGKAETGLKYLHAIPTASEFYVKAAILRGMAQLGMNRVQEARKIALDLWKNVNTRRAGTVLLSLLRQFSGRVPLCPSKIRDEETTGYVTEVLTDWSRAASVLPGYGFNTLVQELEQILKHIPVQGYIKLVEYYRKKELEIKAFFEHKFGG